MAHDMHNEGIDKDGMVAGGEPAGPGMHVETYYQRAVVWTLPEHREWVEIDVDGPGYNFQTRLSAAEIAKIAKALTSK